MSRRVELRREAFAHVAEAFLWYRAQRPGLEWEFDADLQAVFTLLRQVPEAGPVVYRDLRRAVMHRFPYAVYYRLPPGLIEVRAVLHTHRHPRAWQSQA